MKLGMWAEKIGILDENPAGFRRGRSMSDVVQVMVRMQEDVEDRRRRVDVSERLLGEREWSEARHLYLRKALLRVNKSGLWGCWTEMIESGDGVTSSLKGGGACSTSLILLMSTIRLRWEKRYSEAKDVVVTLAIYGDDTTIVGKASEWNEG